jgi:hypothetical protein
VVRAVGVVEALAAISFAGVICAPAMTVGGDGGSEVKWWCSGDDEDGGGFPSLATPLLDWDGEYQWGVVAQVNLISRACQPPPLFIV